MCRGGRPLRQRFSPGTVMFDFVAKHKRILQIVLGLTILPFAFFGLESYTRASAARHGRPPAWTARRSPRANSPTKCAASRTGCARCSAAAPIRRTLDTPEMRLAILESLISQRLVMNEVANGAPRDVEGRRGRQHPLGARIPGRRQVFQRALRGLPARASGCRTRATWRSCASRSRRARLASAIAATAIQPRTVAERLVALRRREARGGRGLHRRRSRSWPASSRTRPR